MAGPDDWNAYDFVVQMPHLAPGEKLSEVEFLKIIAAHQWESIARALGTPPSKIVNDQGERLYGSVIDVELCLGERHSMELLGEDAHIYVRNRVRFFAKKFVEGLFVIDDREISDDALTSVKTREDLPSLGTSSWACMTNAFIARAGGNVRLKVFRPAGGSATGTELETTPFGILEQGRVQSSGEIQPLAEQPGAIALSEVRRPGNIAYRIVPESDLNGAGLVYFARYEAMMNYGERVFLTDHLDVPVSTELVSYLSTEHRRAFFFANASPTDTVLVHVRAELIPRGDSEPGTRPGGYRVPFKLQFRLDLYRGSDNVLMASSLVRKSLNVPGNAKAVLAETDRLLRRWLS